MAKKKERKFIYIYADWKELKDHRFMGTLSVDAIRGTEVFSFDYDKAWLAGGYSQQLDPELQLYEGGQYLTEGKLNFGIFLDSCPDRWGRVLMDRREALLAREEKRKEAKLYESDYLLGVYDGSRMGALRYKLELEGDFLNNYREFASPPWSRLRELEQASLKLEEEGVENTDDYSKWINMLISPGSSLGGARPKAGVVDEEDNLWIAKFPSKKDDADIGAWEMVAYQIALEAGVEMAECKIQKFNSQHHTFMTKRFDREAGNIRKHFASAMTCLGKVDGEDGSSGVSYLELAAFIVANGSNVNSDLEELWRRIVLSICITNVDDHLRNHGFVLTGHGWKLSPAYDLNPIRDGEGLKLNITETDNSQNLDVAMSVVGYFRLSELRAKEIIKEIKSATQKWRAHARGFGIPTEQQDLMARAFRI